MLTVNLFKSMFNTQPEQILIDEESKAIKDCVPEVDFENAVIFVNGFQKDKNYILKEGDVCTIRITPALITTAVGLITATVKSAINHTNWVDEYFGYWYTLEHFLIDSFVPETNAQQSQTKSIPSLSGGKNQDGFGKPVPIVLGRTLNTPIICGSVYHTISGTDGENQIQHTCYLLGYTYLDVKDIKLGNNLLIKNTGERHSGLFNASEYEEKYRDGDNTKYGLKVELGQDALPTIYQHKVFEEPCNIELTNLDGESDRLELDRFSAKYPMKIELEFTLQGLIGYDDKGNEEEKEVDIQLLISFDGGETKIPFAQIDGSESTTEQESEGISVIKRKKNKVMRFVATYELAPQNAINCKNHVAELFITRTNKQSTDSNTTDKVYLSAIRTWCYDPNESSTSGLVAKRIVDSAREEMCTFIALEVQATDKMFEGQLDEFTAITTSRTYCYDNGKWGWNDVTASPRRVTSNPASLALTILKHPSRGRFIYQDSQIDYESFGEFYDWCEQNRSETDTTPKFQCNGLLTNKMKTKDILDTILACGRAKLILDGKKLSVWIDKPRDIPVMILNNQNLLSMNTTKSFDELPDGYKIKFVNEQTWQTDEWKIPLKDPMPANPMYESIELPFQTHPKQVWQNAYYLYATKKLRPEVWTVKVSVDGNLLDIGSLVEIQNEIISVGIGDGAEILRNGVVIENGYITKIITDGNMYIDDTTKTYGVKITCADGVNTPKVMSWELKDVQAGEQNVFVFKNPILASSVYKPNEGDIVSFGIYQNETTRALCFGKKDNGDGTFELTLVPYQAGIYTADSGTVPDFVSNVTEIPERSSGNYTVDKSLDDFAEVNRRITEIETGSADVGNPDNVTGVVAVAKQNNISIGWNAVTGGGLANTIKSYTVEISKDNGETWTKVTSTETNTAEYTFNRDTDHYPEATTLNNWKIRVQAENIYGKKSPWNEQTVNTSIYGTWIPSVLNFSAKVPSEGGINLSWGTPTGSNNKVLYGTNTFVATVLYNEQSRKVFDVTTQHNATYNFNRTVDQYPEVIHDEDSTGLDLYTFKLKVINESGNYVESTPVGFTSTETADYGTWKPNAVSPVGVAGENGIDFTWVQTSGVGGRTLYGSNSYRLTVKYNSTERTPITTSGLSATYTFDRRLDKYPEKIHDSDHTGLDLYSAKILVINSSGNSAETASPSTIDSSQYLTWIPNSPTDVVAIAYKDYISLGWDSNQDSVYGVNKFRIIKLQTSIKENLAELGWDYIYDRRGLSTDEYPEKSNLLNDDDWMFYVEVYNQSGNKNDTLATYNLENYKTWIPAIPVVSLTSSSRTISADIRRDDSFWGWVRYELQISKDRQHWFSANTSSSYNPYSSEDSWKGGAENTDTDVISTMFSMEMPLEGQSTQSPVNTNYYVRLRTVNQTWQENLSNFCDYVTVIARATSAKDVVDSAITNSKLATGAVTHDKIASHTIQTENLSAVAVNKINSFVGSDTQEGDTSAQGWSFTEASEIAIDSTTNLKSALVNLFYGAYSPFHSDIFDVEPEEILKFSAIIDNSNNETAKVYIGTDANWDEWHDAQFKESTYNFTTGKWSAWTDVANDKFSFTEISGNRRSFTSYICGCDVRTEDLPSPLRSHSDITVKAVRCAKVSEIEGESEFLNKFSIYLWSDDEEANPVYLITPMVTSVTHRGTIVAEDIKTESLSAITANLGDVASGSISSAVDANSEPDPANSLIYLNGKAGNEEFYVGNVAKQNASETNTNHQFIRLYKSNGVFNFIIKITKFIVTATQSVISGVFRVKTNFSESDTNAFMTVNPSDSADNGTSAKTVKVKGSLALDNNASVGGAITSTQDNNSFLWINKNPRGKFVGSNGGSTGGWSPLLAGKTVGGKYEFGSLNNTVYLNYYKDNRTTNGVDKEVFSYTQDGTPSWNGSSTSVKDSGNNTLTTFAYSKAGLTGNPSWLAVWNNYELRAIAPSQITSGSTNNLNGSVSKATKDWKTLDLSSLNASQWFPVTFYLGTDDWTEVECYVSLDSGTKPSWSSHQLGFTCHLHLFTMGSGWGTTPAQTVVLDRQYGFTTVNNVTVVPVGWTQMTNSSIGVLWLRGGGKYFCWNSKGTTFTIRTSTYTSNSQSVSPTTSYQWSFTSAQMWGTLNGTASSCSGNSATATRVRYTTTRQTSANVLAKEETASLTYFLATSTMTTGKPAADGSILNMAWDNNGGWSAQAFFPHLDGTVPQYRCENGGTWGKWHNFITAENIASQSVNYANSSGSCSGNSATADYATDATYLRVGSYVKAVIEVNGTPLDTNQEYYLSYSTKKVGDDTVYRVRRISAGLMQVYRSIEAKTLRTTTSSTAYGLGTAKNETNVIVPVKSSNWGTSYGYIEYVTGLKIQWGRIAYGKNIAASDYGTFNSGTLSLAFSNNSYTLVATNETSNAGSETYVYSKATNSFSIRVWNRNSSTAMTSPVINWIAIGY